MEWPYQWLFVISAIISVAGIFLLYLVIVKMGIMMRVRIGTKKQKILLSIATATMLLLSILFTQEYKMEGAVNLLYGFPYTFLTIFNYNLNLPIAFAFNPLQMLFNILVIYFFILLFYKLYSKIFLPKLS